MQTNVLDRPIESCSTEPMTGFYRDGCCRTGEDDAGKHTICVQMTAPFLAFSKSKGNDLSTPRPQYGFPGLQAGDRWCLCAARWVEAFNAECAPEVLLEGTHSSVLEMVPLPLLLEYAVAPQGGLPS